MLLSLGPFYSHVGSLRLKSQGTTGLQDYMTGKHLNIRIYEGMVLIE
jgi:hypothetical protein